MGLDQSTTSSTAEAVPGRRVRGGPPGWIDTVLSWPRRRWAAVAVLIPVTTTAFLWAGLRLPPETAYPFWGWPVAALAGVLAGLTLSSYLPGPGTGHLIHVGCSPCALASAASVVFALVLRWTSPASAGLAAISIAVLALGLQRRLSDEASCPVSAEQVQPR
ncbi:MAG: hypothetical protein HKP61_04945 [Dactylosporangium sp.]|nr:hypothetical protein [Dactylosporangium sp.]NNJ60293.1 hypothetical protein [Dactylosporangium sp.]